MRKLVITAWLKTQKDAARGEQATCLCRSIDLKEACSAELP